MLENQMHKKGIWITRRFFIYIGFSKLRIY